MTAGRLERFYFETSAVNAVASQLSRDAAMNTRAYQNLRGRGYFISPLVIFEVLTTKDDQRREELIYFSQHLFEPTLLPSPEELVVNYIQQGCPRVEPEYHLASGGNTAAHWRLICEDTRKTLLYDRDAIDFHSQTMRQIGRLLFDFHSHRDVRQPIRGESTGLNLSAFEIIRRYGLANEQELEDSAVRQHIGLVVILIVVVLCSGITLDREPIEQFWRRKGIDSIIDRIHFTFENYANLVRHGPFHLLAIMIDVHSDRTFSRGMIFDCMHAVYAIYADKFLTADQHFVEMRTKLPGLSSATNKIWHLDELQMNWIDTTNPPPPKSWLEL